MEDKTARSRRSGLDRCGDGNVSLKKQSNELCFDDSFARSRSGSSPSCHKKTHFGLQVEKGKLEYRNEDYQQTNATLDRCRDQKQKDHKAEVHRLAEFVCGDWSEHVSSSGKRYYYNCKTEVSQWEKPKDWNDILIEPLGNELQQHFPIDQTVDQSGKDDLSLLHQSQDTDDGFNNRHSFVSKKVKTNNFSATMSALNACTNPVASDGTKIVVGSLSSSNSQHEDDKRHFVDSFKSSSLVANNCHRSESQTSLPLCASGIYGLVSSSRESSSANRHNGSKSVEDSNRDVRMAVDEDMDISPGSTPTEESLLEKRLHAIGVLGDKSKSVVCAVSPAVSQLIADRGDDLFETLQAKNSSPSSATFLSTLTSLQQALHHVTPAGNSSTTKSVPSSTLNLLASLPSLVNQLQEAERDPAATMVTSQYQQSNQQHILQQVIHMLQKLQQALVAQQQQQQQRQLQDLLRQLLSMQKPGSNNSVLGTSLSGPLELMTQKNNSVEDLRETAKLESPYSPPDSDGTPLGSPENRNYIGIEETKQTDDVTKNNDSPKSNEHGGNAVFLKHSSNSPDRIVAATVAGCSNSLLIVLPGTVQSTALISSSHLASGVHRKQHDSINLTPTLANYVNNRLTDHISSWQTDAVERQVNYYSEESNSCSSLQCTQISVDLKQARSLVRLNEIQTTLQEQRVMFIRQQTKDLENMRTGYVFQTNVHNIDT